MKFFFTALLFFIMSSFFSQSFAYDSPTMHTACSSTPIAKEVTGSGVYIAPTNFDGGKLQGDVFIIPSGHKGIIISASSTGNGFHIKGPTELSVNDPDKALGSVLKAGGYHIFPYLKRDQVQASASVILRIEPKKRRN